MVKLGLQAARRLATASAVLALSIPTASADLELPPDATGDVSGAPTWTQFLVDIRDHIPDVPLDIRYHTDYNFIGRKIDAYNAPKCLLTRKAAEALAAVQEELGTRSMSIKIYDCYRPQMAVDQFVLWAQDLDDEKMKEQFYPNVAKDQLFADGYIASQSGHSRASTVDLTIVPLPVPEQTPCRAGSPCEDNGIDMGTPFDYFDPKSHAISADVSEEQQANRELLHLVMLRHGFTYYPAEWWHFTIRDEPYPDTYFNFPIE